MDPYDADISKRVDPTARPFLRGAQALPPEESNFQDETISDFDERHGIPYTAVKLGYGEKIQIDPEVEMKVKAIEQHIKGKMREEGLRDSPFGYNTIFNRMASNLGDTMESAKNHGSISKMLNSLFFQVSVENRASSKTYLQNFTKQAMKERVERLTSQLRIAFSQLHGA